MVYIDDHDPFDTRIKHTGSLATFSQEFSNNINYKTLEKTALYITWDFRNYAFQCTYFTENYM